MQTKHFIIAISILTIFASCTTKQTDESKLGFSDYNFIVALVIMSIVVIPKLVWIMVK